MTVDFSKIISFKSAENTIFEHCEKILIFFGEKYIFFRLKIGIFEKNGKKLTLNFKAKN